MDEIEIRKIVREELRFVYNEKYRFDKPVEIAKAIYLSDLPTSSTGLKTGQLWSNSGVINII